MTEPREHLRCLVCGKVSKAEAFRRRDHEMERLTQSFVGGTGRGHGFAWDRRELDPYGGDREDIELIFSSAVAVVERLRRFVDPRLDPEAALLDRIEKLEKELEEARAGEEEQEIARRKAIGGREKRGSKAKSKVSPPLKVTRPIVEGGGGVAAGRPLPAPRCPSRSEASALALPAPPLVEGAAETPSPASPVESRPPPSGVITYEDAAAPIVALFKSHGRMRQGAKEGSEVLLDFVREMLEPLLLRGEAAIAQFKDVLMGEPSLDRPEEAKQHFFFFAREFQRAGFADEDGPSLLDLTRAHAMSLIEHPRSPKRADGLTERLVRARFGDEDPEIDERVTFVKTVGHRLYTILHPRTKHPSAKHGRFQPS